MSSTRIDLTWADNSDNEDGFKVERSLSGVAGFAQIATVGANVTSYSDTGLEPGTPYGYRVRAYNAAGSSAYSNIAITNTFDIPPAAPSGLTATAVSSTQIDLSWVDNADNEDGFDIKRSLSAASGFAVIASVGADITTYQDTALSPSTTYYYRVSAYNSAGASGNSPTANATTSPPVSIPLGSIKDVAADGAYAYVASRQYGLVVVDVQEVTDPRGVAAAEVGFIPYQLDREGSLVVVTGGPAGIKVVDVSSPSSPSVTGSLAGYYASAVDVDGGYAYLTDPAGYLRVVDLSEPAHPSLAAELPVEGTPYDISVALGYAYVATGSSLLVADVSFPANPHVVGRLDAPCQVVDAEGKLAYTDGLEWGGVRVVDVSDPTMPVVVGEQQTGCRLTRFVAQGAELYAVWAQFVGTSTGLLIMDVSIASDPLMTAAIGTEGTTEGMDVQGDYAYLADGTPGLHIFNISDPYEPVLVSTAQ